MCLLSPRQSAHYHNFIIDYKLIVSPAKANSSEWPVSDNNSMLRPGSSSEIPPGMLCLAIFLALCPLLVASHGNMVWPPTWFDPDGKDGLRPGGVGLGENLPMAWFSNWTLIPEDQEATLDPWLFTVPDFHGDAWSIWDRVNCLALEGLHMMCARPGTRSTQPGIHGWLQAQPPSSALAGGVAAILRVAVGSLMARSVQEVVTVLVMTQEA